MEIEKFNENKRGNDKKERKKRNFHSCDSDELLNMLKQYREEYGKIPSELDLKKDSKYYCAETYRRRFGSYTNALRLVGFDADNVIKEEKLSIDLLNTYQKGRLGELLVFNSFKEKNRALDLSGKNYHSIFDGICPRGLSYDVKVASLKAGGYNYRLKNKGFERIDYFYLVAVNKEYTELHYIWLIPKKEVKIEKGFLYIGKKKIHEFDKYLVDFSKCNLDFLNKNDEKED